MRLLRVDTLEFVELDEPATRALAKYAILSHTWRYGHEVLFEDVAPTLQDTAKLKPGFSKVANACRQAAKDGLEYSYYALSAVCYVYLEDVKAGPGWEDRFRQCRWLTRVWTLQELIAPIDVFFYDTDWTPLCNLRDDFKLIASITALDVRLLQHKRDPESYSVAQRMSWAAKRRGSRIEDSAYSLLGIFDVHMTMLYGEGTNAFRRLQEEIIRVSTDHSIFAWERLSTVSDQRPRGVWASSPADFGDCKRIGRLSGLLPGHFKLTNRGLKFPLPLVNDISDENGETILALLDCYRSGQADKPYFALELQLLTKVLHSRNGRVDPALFAPYAIDSYLVNALRHVTEDDFKQYAGRSRAEKISLFGGEDFRTIMFTPEHLGSKTCMESPARYTRSKHYE
ncbi:hypothetical protein LTR02_000819 [Friedmanniomyces endolithicus]|nr:hypothetical protein LTR94_003582 [Friedmanniomyces endolithicus]KAK0812119.1 hypothetical protein LTR59_001595 [Friedmanniomyces endolithicus]KAK0847390.1 hypothetical protein LTR03_006367 [Friedmanniomyces endolithicus]KAK0916272.1 hypothetical protein LTR02_000819 [Friedmanniomyces endolithicus]